MKAALAARARARSNIALAKYWGKSDVALNLPAVPSLSLTLEGLTTETEVVFSRDLGRDELVLGGHLAGENETRRASELLDRVRAAAEIDLRARVTSRNDFPTASGLASSASGFAALAAAAAAAAGLDWSATRLSREARRSSASAARSIFGGFVELPAGDPGDDRLAARAIAAPEHWDVRMVVAVGSEGAKEIGSTEGMERSRRTSAFYDAWIDAAPALFRRVKSGVKSRDIVAVGEAMEQSTLAFHACAIAAAPAILYWAPVTLAALRTVRDLRERRGIPVYATMDAGPHVKALCEAEHEGPVRRALARTEGVLRTIVASPGRGVEWL